MDGPNTLFYGDNLDILRNSIGTGSVDLIYLDPPFNSKRDYNVLFKEKSGEASPAQIEAFTDTWAWDRSAEAAYAGLVTTGPEHVGKMIGALRGFLGTNDMMAYLVMMAARLVELHRVLKPTGSLYLHCDPTASHYLKVVLDTVFEKAQFRNEVIWRRTSGRKAFYQYGRIHDVLLFYTRSDESTWNAQTSPQTTNTVRGHDILRTADGGIYRLSDLTAPEVRYGETGLVWRNIDVTAKGRHWAYPPSELETLDAAGRIHWSNRPGGLPRLKIPLSDLAGTALTDLWMDIDPINASAGERLGYPTQTPLALLERIIAASSNPGDVVLDPFCGCGTAVVAAQKLGRTRGSTG